MSDDYRAEPALGLPSVTEHPQRDLPRRRRYDAYSSHAKREPPLKHSFHDVASVLGAPADSLPAPVMEAALRLLGEIERLRWQVEQDGHHIAHLEQLADADPVLPCLNRRAFLRDLDAFLEDKGGGADPMGTVAAVHVGGIERLSLTRGLAAAEAALRYAAAILQGGVRASDLTAHLDGGDFAMLFTVADRAGAEERLAAIRARLNFPAFIWDGEEVDLPLRAGFHLLVPGEDAETALAAADRDRHGRD